MTSSSLSMASIAFGDIEIEHLLVILMVAKQRRMSS